MREHLLEGIRRSVRQAYPEVGDEILAHFQAIADKYDLVEDALFHTRVEKTEWDEGSLRWRVRTDRGDEITAKYVVMAVGILNLMKVPAIPGMDRFRFPSNSERSSRTGRSDCA